MAGLTIEVNGELCGVFFSNNEFVREQLCGLDKPSDISEYNHFELVTEKDNITYGVYKYILDNRSFVVTFNIQLDDYDKELSSKEFVSKK